MRIPQITSVRVCTCAMARIVEAQRPLFPLQFLNLLLCRPDCTQFTDGQLKDSFDNFSTGSWLKRSAPDSFRESFSWHLHHFPCQHASDRLNKQDRSLLCIRAAPSRTVVHWCWEHWEHWERPPFPSKVVIHSPRILMFGNSWISTGRWEKHGETRNSHEINITQPWRVESLSFFSSFFMLFFANEKDWTISSQQQIDFVWTTKDWPCIVMVIWENRIWHVHLVILQLMVFVPQTPDISWFSLCFSAMDAIPSIQWHSCSRAT